MQAAIRVSGNIISELSEKIPSNIIALNELMKNAYDAGASYVKIAIDSKMQTLTIWDDGAGMDVNDINTLFHISNSEKRYGEINQYGRRTQGSKGLGFLSVFKFGNNVLWKTNKTEGIQFSLDFNGLIASEDISHYPIELFSDNSIPRGTQIIITLSEYNLGSLLSYLSEPINSSKIVNAFDDSSFLVELHIDEVSFSSKNLTPIERILPDRQLYTVKYTSTDSKVKFYVKGELAFERDFPINDPRYSAELEIVIFHLKQYDRAKVHAYYHNPKDELTPLLFVNSNLFANYNLFDPNIMRQIKSSSVLAQMIGYVRITSSDILLNFNSDRTQFLQNPLTDKIEQFLLDINKLIQEVGSEYKNCLPDLDFLKKSKLPYNATDVDIKNNIKSEFSFKDKVAISRQKNMVEYMVFGTKRTAIIEERVPPQKVPARIVLSDEDIEIPIPSPQINLCTYIEHIVTSENVKIDSSAAVIYVDGIQSTSKILNSITEEKAISIRFEYIDAHTGSVVEDIILQFFQPEAEVTADTTQGKLLTIPAMTAYSVGFNLAIQRLILQLNQLDSIEYLEVIACSLRTLFDIATDDIRLTGRYPSIFTSNPPLEDKVKRVIEYIASDNTRISTISINSGIGFQSLKNLLLPDEFHRTVAKSHLGTHRATTYLSEPEIKEIANRASLFVVIANEMIANTI